MTTVSSASAAVTECAKVVVTTQRKNNGINGKVRVMCRYGGSIVSLPQTKSLHYIGGDTRIVAVPFSVVMSYASLVSHLTVTLGISYNFKVKYQLPDYELDSLISVETDEDVQSMMEEHGFVSSEFSRSQTRIRLFLFPLKGRLNESGLGQGDPAQCKTAGDTDWLGIEESKSALREKTQPVLQHPKTEKWFVDVLRTTEMMQNGRNSSSGDGNGGICGQESMVLETNSSFGSTSSSSSSSNSPPMKSTDEDIMANSHDIFAPIESVASDKAAVSPITSHELPMHPHVFENLVHSNLYEPEINKPVPIPVPGYGPSQLLNHSHQHVQPIYTGQPYGNSSRILPTATSYSPTYQPIQHHTNQIHYQVPVPVPVPPQPYPVYYIAAPQYNPPVQTVPMNTPKPPAKPQTTQHVDSPVIGTTTPQAPEFLHVDQSPQTPSETLSICRDVSIYNTDLDDDAARAQIYKTQPPAPILLPSQYQTMMRTGQLHKLDP